MTARPHQQLGRLVGQLLAVVFDFDSDPISRVTGYYGSPVPRMVQLCAAEGTTLQAVADDVDARCDSKTAYYLGLGLYAAEAEAQGMAPELPKGRWLHVPGRLPDTDHATEPGASCFSCWCYSCGASTAGPRVEHVPDAERHHGDPSHRWCFE